MSRAKDYKAMVHEELTLPSGHVFTVKEPDPMAIASFFDELGVTMDREKLAESLGKVALTQKLTAGIKLLVPAAVVDPVVVDGEAEEDELSVTSIKFNDLMAIMDYALGITRITEEANKDDTFPGK